MLGLLVLSSANRVSAQSVVVFDASTLALQNGDVVSSWGGQAAVGSPTFLTNQTPGGGPAVAFNGVTDRMGDNISFPPSTVGDWILVAVIKPRNLGAYHNIVDDDAQTRPMLWIDPSFRYELNFRGGSGAGIGAGAGPGGWDIVIADSRFNQLYVNSPTPNATGGGGVTWGLGETWDFFHRDGQQTFQGIVAELRLYNDRAEFGGDFAGLYNQMRAKWFNAPPVASTGPDFSVKEGKLATLNGSLSADPDGDPLTYAWTQVPGGTSVTLGSAEIATPNFFAPSVAVGGETLSFKLTVTANGKSSSDTVSVTVVNVNHPPVADAGEDQSVAEGSNVILHGESSFDIDTDAITYSWVQVAGPAVTLVGDNTTNPTFTAPFVGTSGAPGIVATLIFELRVDDGYPQDAPAPGFTLANIVDRVTVEITNVNNYPTAAAGLDQTVNENTVVALNGIGSSDPDNDTLTYAWVQLSGGLPVALSGANTARPTFTAPFVNGNVDLVFQLTVEDGNGGRATDNVVIHVQNTNSPPLATAARPTIGALWPPDHSLMVVGITGVADPNDNATITITGVSQDESTNGQGDGDTPIDAVINADGTVLLRAERSGTGDGRVYHVSFTASDIEGSTSGVVKVSVPHSPKKPAIDSGQHFNSTR